MNEEQKWKEMFEPLAREGEEGAPANVERKLMAAFRARRAARRRWRWMGVGAVAAAAAVVAVLGLRTPERVPLPEVKIAKMPAPVTVAMAEPAPVKVSRRRARPVRRAVEEMVFYAIPNAGVDEPIERGEVVRVKLPQETVTMFGYAAADFVLGEDGTARAVRFVR